MIKQKTNFSAFGKFFMKQHKTPAAAFGTVQILTILLRRSRELLKAGLMGNKLKPNEFVVYGMKSRRADYILKHLIKTNTTGFLQ